MKPPESTTGTTMTTEGSPESSEYGRILVPLDGTAFAEAAITPAADLADRAGASLHLATALGSDAGTMVPVEPVPPEGLRYLRKDGDVRKLLSEAVDRIRERWDCDVSYEVLEDSDPARALLRHARELDADLVVAATHSRGLIRRTVLGSTAADLMKGLSCPTLLVPSSDPEPDPESTPLQDGVERIVVAVDPRRGGEDEALAHAVAWARLHLARLELVQVVLTIPVPTPGSPMPSTLESGLAITEERRQLAEDELGALAARLRAHGLDVHQEVLHGPDVADALSHFAARREADLLVVGRHDKGLLERIWSGSESDRLQRSVRSCGLLVCPLDEAR